MTHAEAGTYLVLLWGGVMVGRFIGAWLMRTISPGRVLAGASLGALCGDRPDLERASCAVGLVTVGLCHSIMFPTIFTLGIRGLGPLTEEGSGLFIMAIAGGALVAVQG